VILEAIPPLAGSGATLSARVVTGVTGLVLAGWTLFRLRNRSLLASLGSIFLSVSAGLILFAFVQRPFNSLAQTLGIYYPPLLYLIVAVTVLMMMSIHMAARISALDVKYRRIIQEIALQKALEADAAGDSVRTD
jgi:hypothetical protein